MLKDWRYDALLALTVLIWGLNFPVAKVVLAVVPPIPFNAVRMTFSLVVVGAYYLWRFRDEWPEVKAQLQARPWSFVGIAVLVSGLYQLFFIFGLDFTTSGNAALILASVPLWTALIGWVSGQERLPRAAWAGLLISFSGTITVVIGGSQAVDFSGRALLGNVLILGAALSWALYTVWSRPLMKRIRPLALTFVSLLAGPPIFFALSAPYLTDIPWADLGLGIWAGILFSGALSTGAAYIFYNVAVRQLGASQAAAWTNVVPFVALFTGLVFLSEPVTAVQLGGGALLLSGLYVMRRARRKKLNH